MNSYRRILVSSKDSPDGEPTAVEVGPIVYENEKRWAVIYSSPDCSFLILAYGRRRDPLIEWVVKATKEELVHAAVEAAEYKVRLVQKGYME